MSHSTATNPYQAQIEQLTVQISQNEQLLLDPDLRVLAEQEIAALTVQKKALEDAVLALEGTSAENADPLNMSNNCIFEIRAGTGGDEAKLWSGDLMRMYMRFCEMTSFKLEVMGDSMFRIRGKKEVDGVVLSAFEYFRSESGVHRVQRVPVTESQGRIHTSTASVAVLPEIHEKAILIRPDELSWQFSRAGGAGGQNVNKVNTAVELTHVPSGIKVESRRERHQERNREIALQILRAKLWEIEEDKRLAKIDSARAAIGRNERSEKIKTYNFPQNRITDHRINKSWYNLSEVLDGNMEKMLDDTNRLFKELDESQQETTA